MGDTRRALSQDHEKGRSCKIKFRTRAGAFWSDVRALLLAHAPESHIHSAAVSSRPPLKINRAPVLTLWAAVVAEKQGFHWDEAVTIGK